MLLGNLYHYTKMTLRSNEQVELEDYLENIIKIQNIKYEIRYKNQKQLNIPTLIFVNHYARPLVIRKWPFTAIDSAYTSALVSLAHKKISNRKLTWVVKKNISTNFFGLKFKQAEHQLKLIAKYDLVSTSGVYPFSSESEYAKKLKNNCNLALYPEGKPSYKLKNATDGFDKVFNMLKKSGINYQILPVSIFYEGNKYYLSIGKTIRPNSQANKTLEKTMLSIASGLPKYLRGKYSA